MAKVILSTFAGRFDRMHILLRYAEAALKAELVSEVHLWDFCRQTQDRTILDAKYPIGFTPGDGREYGAMQHHIFDRNFRVKLGEGTGFLCFGHHRLMLSHEGVHWNIGRDITTTSAVGVELRLTRVNGGIVLTCDGVDYMLEGVDGSEVRLGSTVDALWDFGTPWKVMKVHPSMHNRHFSEYYRHYHAFQKDEYSDTVLMKADDDVVYMDLEKLGVFLDACRDPSVSLATANVINNAYHLYAGDFMERYGCKVDGGGSYPDLYYNGAICERLHDAFLNGDDVDRDGVARLSLGQQFSINFIGMSSRVFEYFDRIAKEEGYNDECFMSIDIPKMMGQEVGVVKPLVVSHLSFYTQEGAMNTHRLITQYATRAPPPL